MSSETSIPSLGLVVEQAPDALIFADSEGIIRLWNAAATRVFGFSPGEAVGQNLDIIIPENFREAHWKGYDRALADGETKYRGQSLPTRAMRAGGETIYVELSFAIARDAAGTVLGALAAARDITTRFESDRATRNELRDLRKTVEELRARA